MKTSLEVARALRAIAKKMGQENGFSHDLRLLAHKLEQDAQETVRVMRPDRYLGGIEGEARREPQPPCDNAHVAPGCERFPEVPGND